MFVSDWRRRLFSVCFQGDGTRGFYESLFEENKNSLVALRYVVEWGVLTGTLLHESLPRYFALREKGAFKGAAGGLQKAFMNGGLEEAEIKAATKMLNVRRRWDSELTQQ
ncbi:hypothetical protein Efla_006616 [Eimeria flavescens]